MTAIAIHGGAGALPRSDMTVERAEEFHAGLRVALRAGHAVLKRGGPSLEAVTRAVVALEDCPLFNAGRGASFNREGFIEMEASIMNGADRRAGAALLLRHVRNPVLAARLVMEHTPHVMVAGEAAEKLAREHGLAFEPDAYFFTQYRWEAMLRLRGTNRTALSEDVVVDPSSPEASSTVGAVAVDRHHDLAAATSSGGTTNKYAGRVGQACLVGAGVYAQNDTCAVSCTGQGEAFIRSAAAHDLSALMEHRRLDLETAAEKVVRTRLPGRGGLVAVDRSGRCVLPYNTEGMYRGWIDSDGRLFTAIYNEIRAWPHES